MCCTPVSSHEIGHVFQSEESCQDRRGPKKVEIGTEWTRVGLGPGDVNLQTEKIYCNYSVLIGSPE